MVRLSEEDLFLSSNVMKLCDLIVTDNNKRWIQWKTDQNKYIIVNETNTEDYIKEQLKNVKNIMVKIDFINYFERQILPHIKEPFNLVTHLSDFEVNSTHIEILLNPYLKVWYGQNVNFNFPKLKSLPIGLEDLHYKRTDPKKTIELSETQLKKRT